VSPPLNTNATLRSPEASTASVGGFRTTTSLGVLDARTTTTAMRPTVAPAHRGTHSKRPHSSTSGITPGQGPSSLYGALSASLEQSKHRSRDAAACSTPPVGTWPAHHRLRVTDAALGEVCRPAELAERGTLGSGHGRHRNPASATSAASANAAASARARVDGLKLWIPQFAPPARPAHAWDRRRHG